MVVRRIGTEERRARLATRHWLAPQQPESEPTRDVVTLAGRLCGLHATDPATPYLSARARIAGFQPADLDTALYDERRAIRALGMRRTMFVVDADSLPVMQGACTAAIERKQRAALVKLIEAGGLAADGTVWLERIEAEVSTVLRRSGGASAAELAKALPELAQKVTVGGDSVWGTGVSVGTKVLFVMGCAGRVVRGRPTGSWTSSQHRWADSVTWFGAPLAATDPPEARAELARRWLAVFGPATAKDLQWWTGWGAVDTKRALGAVGAVGVELDDGVAAFVGADDLDPVGSAADDWVALLPSLDSTAMGWQERGWFLGAHRPAIFDRSGNIGPTIWWNGRIVGGWAQRRTGDVVVRLLEDIGSAAAAAVEQEAAALEAWLGPTRVTPRFPTPIDRDLRG